MNKTFLELVQQKAEREPHVMLEPDWPLTVARQAAKILAIAPAPERPPALAPIPEPTVAPRDNPLEKGAYNQSRITRRYYYNGSWYYY